MLVSLSTLARLPANAPGGCCLFSVWGRQPAVDALGDGVSVDLGFECGFVFAAQKARAECALALQLRPVEFLSRAELAEFAQLAKEDHLRGDGRRHICSPDRSGYPWPATRQRRAPGGKARRWSAIGTGTGCGWAWELSGANGIVHAKYGFEAAFAGDPAQETGGGKAMRQHGTTAKGFAPADVQMRGTVFFGWHGS